MSSSSIPTRLISVDALRGLTVAMMILVNNPGSWEYIYSPLKHAEWHGFTPTDLVFPFFIFLVGVSVALSLKKTKEKGPGNHFPLFIKLLKRSAILFGLGLFLNAFPLFEIESLRIPGVLQRIAIVFLFISILYLNFSTITLFSITIFILIFYWVIMTFIPVPGVGPPNLEPGTNIAAWLDYFILKDHLWKFTKNWDPEGILTTAPAIASGLIGVLTGILLSSNKPNEYKLKFLIGSATLLVAIGLAWHGNFPINKNLWSSSFVLFTSGIAIYFLAFGYLIFDLKNSHSVFIKPLLIFGSNAITAYLLAEILARLIDIIIWNNNLSIKSWTFENLFKPWLSPLNASLFMSIFYMLLIFIPLHILYKKKIFIKV